jgi:hypothetical protein
MVSISLVLVSGAAFAAEASRPVLVPPVKQVRWSEGAPIALAKDATAVVVGDKASPADLAAADLLQRFVAKRFGQTWPVVKESGDLSRFKTLVLVGQGATNGRVESVVRGRQIQLDARAEGTDGYAIEVVADKGVTTVVLTGVNGRGVTYAADTFFQMLQSDGGGVKLVAASIRDWASIPWRGRPMTDVTHYLEPDVWDCLVSSRLNWIDLRNGTYSFEPDYVFTDKDKANIATVIAEAHKRGILVYGAVNVGIPVSQYEAAMNKFREFVSMGVDGLWLSFDDKGGGDHPEQIVYDLLQLGRQHGITGNRICITPPKGSYQTVDAPFNRLIVRVPGMEEALWWWTPLPDERMAADAKKIGLKTKPSWWHNWPRCEGGFTNIQWANLNTDLSRSYVEIPSLAVGWHEPSYEMLSPAGEILQSALPWSGNGVPQEYVATVFGWWCWSPEQHDWTAVRTRAYGHVYGPQQAAAMIEFDDTLVRAKALFQYADRDGDWRPRCPARLKNLADRPIAMDLLNRCEQLATSVGKAMPAATMLDAERMVQIFVAPMQREVEIGKVCAQLEVPEYWWNQHQRKVLDAVHAGDLAAADKEIAAVKPRVNAELAQIAGKLGKLSLTPGYVDWWRKTAGMSAEQWKDMMARRQSLVEPRVWRYSYFSVSVSKMLANLPNVPTGRGRGSYMRQMRVLATAVPEVREQFWGDWTAGIHKEGGIDTAVFAMEPDSACRVGDFAELPVTLPISGDRSRLGLLVFMNRWAKEKLGLEEVLDRWVGYASVQLLWGDKVVWEGDVGLPRSNEWDLVRLPAIPADLKELPLMLRVTNVRDSESMFGLVFVGPIRLVEMP